MGQLWFRSMSSPLWTQTDEPELAEQPLSDILQVSLAERREIKVIPLLAPKASTQKRCSSFPPMSLAKKHVTHWGVQSFQREGHCKSHGKSDLRGVVF